MSSPELKKHDNGVYYIHWNVGRRSKRTSTRQRDEGKAQIFFANWLIVKNQAPADVAKAVKVRDLWAFYCKGHPVVSEDTRENIWKNLKPHFGELLLPEITFETVEGKKDAAGKVIEDGYVQLREKGIIGKSSVSSTIRRELSALRACFNWCTHPKRKTIAPSDIPYFDLPPEGEAKDRWLQTSEIKRLFAVAAANKRSPELSRNEMFLWLALETAARAGAICDLTWDRVDFETGMIHYNVPGRKKTKKRRASVPMSGALRPVLLRAYQERAGDRVLSSRNNIWRDVNKIAELAEIEGVSPHVLRHTAATHMARRGVPLYVIAGILADTLATVERVYAKHCPGAMKEGVEHISGMPPASSDLAMAAIIEGIKSGKLRVEPIE